jgi:glucosamine--fructose-6-phosphate aminotransferase (isomerizing)
MEKEIFEQPVALENAMRGRFSEDGSTAQFGGLNVTAGEFRQIERLHVLRLRHGPARLHGDRAPSRKRFARMPVECDYASEFRYRNAPLCPRTLFFVMSQSGETIDTLAGPA